MAKRIEHIVGLHNLFPTAIEQIEGVDEIYYDLSVSLDYNQSVTENTVLFVDADSEDVNKYIHINSTFKRIRPGDNYIITDGKVYSNNFSIEGQYIPSYVKGPKGEIGPTGPQGEIGPQGPAGDAGYTSGANIDITDNVISAKGYVFGGSSNSFAEGISTASGVGSHSECSSTAIGSYSHAEGETTKADGLASHSEGYNTRASGNYSHAEGSGTYASGACTHTEGYSTKAPGNYSHAEGYYSEAIGSYSHAEGTNTRASADYSHAEGNQTKAQGQMSHAEGYKTTADAYSSHAEGYNTIAQGQAAHAEGQTTKADGLASHSEGYNTIANGQAAHSEGFYTITNNTGEHAEGKYNKSNTGTISSIGIGTSGTDRKNVFEVLDNGDTFMYGIGDYDGTNAVNPNSEGKTAKTLQNILLNKGYFFDDTKKSFTEGHDEWVFIGAEADAEIVLSSEGVPTNEFKTTKSDLTIGDIISINGNIYKIIEKRDENGSYIYTVYNGPVITGGEIYILKCGAIGSYSHSEGYNTIASGSNSHSEGTITVASGTCSHAEGITAKASGDYSHAEGNTTHASGEDSHAEGCSTSAISFCSHAEGYNTTSSGYGSHTEGVLTIASNEAEHAEGKYNKSNSGTISSIGIGTSNTDRKNAVQVMDNGDTFIYGVGEYDGTNINSQNTKGERLPASIQEVLPKYNKEKRSVCFQYNEADNSLNEAQSDYSFVIGYNNKAIREETAETGLTLQAANTFVGGMDNRAYHSNSIVFGEGLYTQFGNTFVLGKYNGTVSNQDGWGDTVLGIVGDGYKDSNGNETRRNVLLLQGGSDSALHCRGGFKNNASWINDFGEYFEWLDGNPDNEDRIGYMVQLNGDKIELATSFKKCIGVISGTTGFIGGVCAIEWHNKFLHDKWGREIIGEDGNPILNPDYDPDLEYIPREQRKEWDVVGLVGQVITRQDGTLEVGGYAGCSKGIATKATSGFKVLKIIDNETALLLVK